MRLSLKNRFAPWAVLGAVFLVHFICNAVWVSSDQTLRGFDEGLHTAAVAHTYNNVAADGVTGALNSARGRRPGQWPSAGYLTWIPLVLAFGESVSALRLYNTLFLALLLSSVFVIGRRLHSRNAGLLAAALLSLYPAVFGASRQFNHDLPYMTFVAMGMALMLTSRRFSRPHWSMLLGLVVGAGSLVRPHAILILMGPALYWFAVSMFRPASASRGKVLSRIIVLVNVALAIGAAAGASAIWWAYRLPRIFDIFLTHREGANLLPWMTDPSIVFYLKSFPKGASPLLLALAAVGLVALWRQRGRPLPPPPDGEGGPSRPWRPQGEYVLMWVWLLAGLGILSLIRVHLNRYQLPLYPPVAVLTGCGLLSIQRRRLRQVLAGTGLVVAVIAWLMCSFVAEMRPLPEALLPCDPCSSRIRNEPWESAGSPAVDPVYKATSEMTDILAARHEDVGTGVLLEMPIHLRMALIVKPLVMTRLPRLLITHRPLDEYGRDQIAEECESLHQTLGGYSIPTPLQAYHHCYTMRVDYQWDPYKMPRPELPVKKIFERYTTWRNARLHIILWHVPDCPPQQVSPYDPRMGHQTFPCP